MVGYLGVKISYFPEIMPGYVGPNAWFPLVQPKEGDPDGWENYKIHESYILNHALSDSEVRIEGSPFEPFFRAMYGDELPAYMYANQVISDMLNYEMFIDSSYITYEDHVGIELTDALHWDASSYIPETGELEIGYVIPQITVSLGDGALSQYTYFRNFAWGYEIPDLAYTSYATEYKRVYNPTVVGVNKLKITLRGVDDGTGHRGEWTIENAPMENGIYRLPELTMTEYGCSIKVELSNAADLMPEDADPLYINILSSKHRIIDSNGIAANRYKAKWHGTLDRVEVPRENYPKPLEISFGGFKKAYFSAYPVKLDPETELYRFQSAKIDYAADSQFDAPAGSRCMQYLMLKGDRIEHVIARNSGGEISPRFVCEGSVMIDGSEYEHYVMETVRPTSRDDKFKILCTR